MRAFLVRMPSGQAYWTVLDDGLRPVPVVDGYLRHLRFGRDAAESTTKAYAGGLALFLDWCERSGTQWREAGGRLGSFIVWLRHNRGDGLPHAGPGAEPVRSAGRVNAVLTAVRGLFRYAVGAGEAPTHVLAQLYQLADARHLPEHLQPEHGQLRYVATARHRLKQPERPVKRATDLEALALLRACRSARARLIVLLLARCGLRRSEAAGLRREDVHFVPDSSVLGCQMPGAHLHVVRRDNPNGAWAKSRQSRVVPADHLVVAAYDQYVAERTGCLEAAASDFVLVNLARPPLGAPMPPDALNDLLTRLSRLGGLTRIVTPHMLRHAFASNIADAGGSVDEIQDLLGHCSVNSSRIYIHPDPARLRIAVERVAANTGEDWR